MDIMLLQIQSESNTSHKINIWVNTESELSITDAIDQYQNKFMKYGFFVNIF